MRTLKSGTLKQAHLVYEAVFAVPTEKELGNQNTESEFLTFKEPKEPIPPAYAAWRADTLFLLGS